MSNDTCALYLIFSHEHQDQLLRLVRSIRSLSPNSVIAIHHDPSKELLDSTLFSEGQGIHIIPDSIHGEWGDFSLVEQYLHAINWCRHNVAFNWLITLTGLCYPAMQLDIFEEQLKNTDYDAFVNHFDAFDPTHWPKGTGINRYLFAYFKISRNMYYYKVPVIFRTFLHRVRISFNNSQPFFRLISMPRGAATRFGVRRLFFPFSKGFTICGGRQMLNLNSKAVNAIFSFLNKNPGYIAYSRKTLIPDESFFTSILANDRNLNVSNEVLRYIKWPKNIQHAGSVAVITPEEVNEVITSEKPFALKFDSRINSAALDLMDEYLSKTIEIESLDL